MPEVSLYRRLLATLGFFTLAAGDFWRFLLSWWGWGAIVAVLLVLAVIELVRERFDVRRMPVTLLAFLALILVSVAWSAYQGWTAVAVVATLVTTTFGIFLGAAFDLRTLLRCLGSALRWILALSLVFELVVSLVIRRHVLPLFPAPGIDYADVHRIPAAFYWSRDLLLSGGRIQGIVGNANLLAFAALLALLVFAIQFAARSASRFWLGFWIIIAIGVLALTRSGTVLVAAAAVLLVGAFLIILRRTTGRARRVTYLGGRPRSSSAGPWRCWPTGHSSRCSASRTRSPAAPTSGRPSCTTQRSARPPGGGGSATGCRPFPLRRSRLHDQGRAVLAGARRVA
ncbi:hypothetical protein GCM10025881_10590 [Pseudolysinimonas kribbensis]|uniref:O-antigen ligase family protein n=1 Tax=Pseudolysinimonas kribbensis TaxID=433641 RepID=A0ABQ6K3T9_9MICO|nr:hypothetical protein [Pseudolysinimonas kribbensis]GMA94235.1 hypothetical protein GCM10025881_10590 [Pseudolysinimonas kribbensis]